MLLQIDRIDTLYYAHSSRIDLKEETRINATSNEAEEFRQQHGGDNGVSAVFNVSTDAYAEHISAP